MKEAKEPAQVEELMKPRYKVIADYPQGFSTIGNFSNPIQKGDVLINLMPQQSIVWRKVQTDHAVHNPELYPDIFRLMQWWEDRDPEEMPEYVKGLHQVKKLLKVEDHGGEYPSILCEGEEIWGTIWMYQPATLSEYTQYIAELSKPHP